MAHRSEEFGLRLVGVLGDVLGVFEFGELLGESCIAITDGTGHAVDRGCQASEFIFSGMIEANGEIATADAIFFYPEISTGIPGPWELSRYHVIPWAHMLEISLLGRRISAERFKEMGLLNEVVESDLMN